jgi:hypothetical protein
MQKQALFKQIQPRILEFKLFKAAWLDEAYS